MEYTNGQVKEEEMDILLGILHGELVTKYGREREIERKFVLDAVKEGLNGLGYNNELSVKVLLLMQKKGCLAKSSGGIM